MSASNPTEVLKAAKWIIEHVGWYQGSWVYCDPQTGKETAFCALGAINRVEAKEDDRARAKRRLMEILPKETKMQYAVRSPGDIAVFNDDHKTTKQMVLDLFDRAIKGVK